MHWRDMESAPKDGTPVAALYTNNLFYEPVCVWWTGEPDYPWASRGNAYPEERIIAWAPIPTLPVFL